MSRFFLVFNLVGILALALLCAVQWNINRWLHLELVDLERTRLEQLATIAERDRTIRNQLADLNEFRDRLTLAEKQLSDLDEKLTTVTHERNAIATQRDQAIQQRDQLKASLDQWMAAVTARDQVIRDAGKQIEKLAGDRNAAITRFNELAKQYNALAAPGDPDAKASTQPAVNH